MAAGAGGVVDLTHTTDVTFALLDEAWAWRHRVVEELRVGSTWHAEVDTTFQIELRTDLLAGFLAGAEPDAVRVLAPLTTKPKHPLLHFGASQPGGSAPHLLLRSSIAAIQAEYLSRLRLGHPDAHALGGLGDPLLEAIAVFSPQVFTQFETRRTSRIDAYGAYLASGLGFDVERADVERWLALQDRAAQVLADALDEPADPYSSSEQVLLALPRLVPLPVDRAVVFGLVEGYATAVEQAAHDDNGLLFALAEYGRRWEVVVEVELPLDRPTSLVVSERRPLGLDWRGVTVQPVAFGDARTIHLQFTVEDHTVEIVGPPTLVEPNGRPAGFPFVEGVRDTSESVALYSADADRPGRVDLRLQLRPTLGNRLTSYLITAIAALSTLAAFLAEPGEDLVRELSLFTVPTTFAIALLLARTETSLASRLQRLTRGSLQLIAALLWATVLLKVLDR